MQARILAVTSLLLIATAARSEEPAPVPREGTYATTSIASNSMKVLPLGKDQIQVTWEGLGGSFADDGKGPTHGASLRCIGSVHAVGGEYRSFTNACVFIRPDGDQIFATETATGRVGGASKGTGTIVGGTGKMAGISGSYEFTRKALRPSAEGTAQLLTQARTSYRLP